MDATMPMLSPNRSFPAKFLSIFSTILALLAFTLLSMNSAQALPVGFEPAERRVYFAALLRDADGQNSLIPLSDAAQMHRMFAASPTTIEQQQKKRRDLGLGHHTGQLLAKKYDRNCFFSPVQCTLQQWGDGNQAEDILLGGGAGRRRRR